MSLREAFRAFAASLQPLYSEREATLISGMVLEKVTGYGRLDMITRPETPLTAEQRSRLEVMLASLLEQQPVQYVLGEAWFCGMPFRVTPAVLIPRPETEELVAWVLEDPAGRAPVVLDLGTGSGCIAVSLKKKMPAARVIGLDVSTAALEIARENATTLEAAVEFVKGDMLALPAVAGIQRVDVIVSNPPYIPASARADMQPQVTEHEPSGALFVPDKDPLLFYRAILATGRALFGDAGLIFVETHEEFAEEVAALFKAGGAAGVTLRRDMQERPRMVRARFGKASGA